MTYQPKPIDTSTITLAAGLRDLTEKLAEHAHDIWAKQRLTDGWTLGPKRDDALKQHPCLIPYAELPESEKRYDRNAALETLKAIVALGYTIAPPLREAGDSALALSPAVAAVQETALLQNLNEAGMSLGMLLDLKHQLSKFRELGTSLPEIDRVLGERLLRLGEPVLAYDAVTDALKLSPEGRQDQRLRQLQALALARIGDTRTANQILEKLAGEPHDNPTLEEETFSILARTYKDLGTLCQSSNLAEARTHWTKALDLYAKAYERTGGYYPGINAAAMALLLDDPTKARELAGHVLVQCQAELERLRAGSHSGDEYWLTATVAEAELIRGEQERAREGYLRARAIGTQAKRFGDMGSTFNQADKLLLPKLGLPRSTVDELFPMPGIAVFIGHMVDRPNRPQPRFPEATQETVRSDLRRWLSAEGVMIGYASAACGSDILFLETILELGGEAHVVLPYSRDLFRKDSVEIVPGSNWAQRFERILARANVREVSQHRLAVSGISYDYANRVLRGLALMHADQLGAELRHLAVWDGRPGDGPGGTASTIERWRKEGCKVDVIDLRPAPPQPAATVATAIHPAAPVPVSSLAAEGPAAEIVVFLFGDVVGFTKLAEPQLLPFEEHFLGLVARLIKDLPALDHPLHRNTWGDAVYLVFPDVGTAGRFALDLRDRIAETTWSDKGLPDGLSMRIGLHAGPAYRCKDSITERSRYLGSHISHAARIEPIAPPGQVYASQPFAALAAASRVADFECRYIGQTLLHKNYGIYPMYHVQRRS
jgi:class 3 adenylate cyclase/tetratricopeptide (TPR) repeat protein